MRAIMASLLMMGALAGCDDKPKVAVLDETGGTVPQVPSVLIRHEEPPLGSALNHRVVRALVDVAGKLEKHWGEVQPVIYTIAPQDRERLAKVMEKSMPPGWRVEQLDGTAPKGTELYAFSSDDRLFGALVVDPQGAPVIPVVILRNRALLDVARRATANVKG